MSITLVLFLLHPTPLPSPTPHPLPSPTFRAFAVAETIGSAYAIETNATIKHILSAQQVISCDMNPNSGLDGCNGGVLKTAFSTLQDVRNLMYY